MKVLASLPDDVLRRYFAYEAAPYEAKTSALLTSKYEGRANAENVACQAGPPSKPRR